ncbi:hypothetical protein C8R43DRAFT_891920, partial [Mycena crocata]
MEVFIKDVLCWEDELPGLYGHTKAYYVTVEQQGRLTLHGHSLLWIRNASSPQEIRERLTGGDSIFEKKMIAYLESAHQGELIHGSVAEVKTRIGCNTQARSEEVDCQSTESYKVPTQTLPTAPPPLCEKHEYVAEVGCACCDNLQNWWISYEHEVDDIVLRSNLHTCTPLAVQVQVDSEIKKDWRGVKKQLRTQKRKYNERKGCLTASGVCKARFPRETFPNSFVETDGHITLKKLEAQLNSFSRVVAYFSRSNSDTTSLLSGTSVKAVVSYVSDYVSKFGLKTYQAFASVFDVFKR